ncbi:MAG: hypothetical protein IKM63_02025 [Firmicutes bacterium]|nr:hypothetical protein [Bacillota bacterium]
MKKVLATLLCLVMTFGILSGCSKTNTDSKPTEASVNSSTEESATEEPTTAPTEQPTESVTTEQPGEEVIIPLFPEENRDQIYQMDPMELLKFGQFYQMFNIHGSGKMDQGEGGIELLTNDYLNRSYEVSNAPSNSSRTTHTITIYIKQSMNNQIVNNSDGPLTFTYYVDDVEVLSSGRFIPLYYNETKQCFVGYWYTLNQSTGEAESYTFVEWYYNGESTPMVGVVDVADSSLYGF